MSKETKIAIIGGSKEANDLALLLAAANIDILFFETEWYPAPSGISTKKYSENTEWCEVVRDCSALVLAPHPFSFPSFNLSVEVPTVVLCRPEWVATDKDKWTFAKDAEHAAEILRHSGSHKPLLAIGRERLMPFYELDSPDLIVRFRTQPTPVLKNGSVATYQPGPFTAREELAFLKDEKIDCIVAHNAGGEGGWPKLEAARELGLNVILINRPELQYKNKFQDVDGVLNWLRQHVSLDV